MLLKTLTFPSISPLYLSNNREQQQHAMIQVYKFVDQPNISKMLHKIVNQYSLLKPIQVYSSSDQKSFLEIYFMS